MLKNMFFNPGALAEEGEGNGITLAGLTRGLIGQEQSAMDTAFVEVPESMRWLD